MHRPQPNTLYGTGLLIALVATALAGLSSRSHEAESPATLLHGRAWLTEPVSGDQGLAPGLRAGMTDLRLDDTGRPAFVGPGRIVLAPARDVQGRVIAPHLADGALRDPTGPLRVLLVVRDRAVSAAGEQGHRALLKAWGHDPVVIAADAPPAAVDELASQTDVAVIANDVPPSDATARLAAAPIGIVCASALVAEQQLGLSYATTPQHGDALVVTDVEHEITTGFEPGPLTIARTPIPLHRPYGGGAVGANLARLGTSSQPALQAIETGADLHERGVAPARRVRLPWGRAPHRRRAGHRSAPAADPATAETDPLDELNDVGRELLRRAVLWAAGGNLGGPHCSGRREGDVRAQLAAAAETSDPGPTPFRDDPPGAMTCAAPTRIALHRQLDGTLLFDDRRPDAGGRAGGSFPSVDRVLVRGVPGQAGTQAFGTILVARFLPRSGRNQFLEVTTDAEAWAFVDGTLAIDLGGAHGVEEQRIDVDRLCLPDGKPCALALFLAHRRGGPVRLRILTNIELRGVDERLPGPPEDELALGR